MDYPQVERNAWAEAASKFVLVALSLTDARERLACISLRTTRGKLAPGVSEADVEQARQYLAELEKERDVVKERCRQAKASLDAAETAFYADKVWVPGKVPGNGEWVERKA